MTVTIDVVDDPARGCAAVMLGAALGGGHVVLTGGSTPRVAYGHFVEAVAAVGVDLRESTFWIGDERCVEPGDERSNYRMIHESLLEPLGPDNQPIVHRIQGELGPDAGAEDYERVLRESGPDEFDLVLLGIGSDGHCASLFPGQATLDERDRQVVGVPQAGLEPFVPRVSLTLPALTSARQILFLATGESKADAILAAFGPDATPSHQTPSSLLAPDAKEIAVLLDAGAAAKLPAQERTG